MNVLLTEIKCPKCSNVQVNKHVHCQKCFHEIDKPYFEKKTGTGLIVKGIAIWTIITLLILLADQSVSLYISIGPDGFQTLLPVTLLAYLVLGIGLFFLIKSTKFSELRISKLAKFGFGLSIASLWIWLATHSVDWIFLRSSYFEEDKSRLVFYYFFPKIGLMLLLALVGGILALFALSKIKKTKEGGRAYSFSSLIIFLIFLTISIVCLGSERPLVFLGQFLLFWHSALYLAISQL